MMRKLSRALICLLLVLSMVFSMVPLTFGADTQVITLCEGTVANSFGQLLHSQSAENRDGAVGQWLVEDYH